MLIFVTLKENITVVKVPKLVALFLGTFHQSVIILHILKNDGHTVFIVMLHGNPIDE